MPDIARWKPPAALLIGASLWGIAWFPMRTLEDAGLRGLWLNLVVFSAATVVGVWLARAHLSSLRRRPLLIAAIVVSAGWTNLAFLLAVLNGNIVRVVLLFYLSPLWAVILGRWILKEALTTPIVVAVAIALGGAFVILWQPQTGFPWPRDINDWLALSSGVAFAVSNIFVRISDDLHVSVKSLAVWFGTSLLAALLILFLSTEPPQWNFSPIGLAVLYGLSGVVAMTWLVQYGVSYLPVQRSAIILLFELVVAAVSQQWLTGEAMLIREWLGGGVIVIAATIAATVGQRNSRSDA